MITLGKRIKNIRKERGLSQSELGKLAKIHPQQICEYETNRVKPSADKLKSLTKVLQVSADYLLFDGERKEEVEFINPELKERILLITKMSKKDQEAIIRVIDGMIVKNHIDHIPRTISSQSKEK